MKKKIILSGAAGICLAVVFTAANNMDVNAYEPVELKSQGNFIAEDFGEGSVALYSSDIYYLHEELNELFKEIK